MPCDGKVCWRCVVGMTGCLTTDLMINDQNTEWCMASVYTEWSSKLNLVFSSVHGEREHESGQVKCLFEEALFLKGLEDVCLHDNNILATSGTKSPLFHVCVLDSYPGSSHLLNVA